MDVLIWLKQELELLADSNSKAHLMHYRNTINTIMTELSIISNKITGMPVSEVLGCQNLTIYLSLGELWEVVHNYFLRDTEYSLLSHLYNVKIILSLFSN